MRRVLSLLGAKGTRAPYHRESPRKVGPNGAYQNIVGLRGMMSAALESASIKISERSFDVHGYPNDGWFQHLKRAGSYNFEFNTARLEGYIRPGAVCLDIGAHCGVISLLMMALGAAKVIALEASPKSIAACRATCAPFPQIEVRQAIVGRQDAKVAWHEDHEALSSSHLVDGGSERSISIDGLKLPRVDFIKMDVEGAELDVLDGAKETLARCNPPVLLEFNTFALVHYRNILPRDALKRIRERFSYIELWPKKFPNDAAILESDEDAEAFLRFNFFHGLADDLLCKN